MISGTENNKIYLVDDDRIVCHSLGLILRKSGYAADLCTILQKHFLSNMKTPIQVF